MSGSNVLSVSMSRCSWCPAGSDGICCELSEAQFKDLSQLMRHRHFEAGSQIVHQDDTSGLFAFVVSGTIKLSRMLPDGRRQIVCFLSEADCLGDLYKGISHDTAECVTEVVLCCFPRKPFEAVLKKHPELEHRLFLRAMNNLDETREWLFALGRKKSPERVAMFLLWLLRKKDTRLSDGSNLSDASFLHCAFSRQEIADFLGLTVETVSRQFSKLRRAGVISLHPDRCIEILDLEALQLLSETSS